MYTEESLCIDEQYEGLGGERFVSFYPKLPLQRRLKNPIERAAAVSAGSKVEDTFDDFLALCKVSSPQMDEGFRDYLGFLV